ncbi:tetratricopeptide repeat protein [bacterium]|nr:tetratricopeptide repeat protein [bacterium]
MNRTSLLNILFLTILIITTSLVFWTSLKGNFTNWDDQMVFHNKNLQYINLEVIKRIFVPRFDGLTYQPVREFSYLLDYQLWEMNPHGYRLANLIYYLIIGIVLYYLFLKLLKKPTLAFIAALIFMVHPLHVEAVAWIAGRKYILMGLFFFLALYLYNSSYRGSSFKRIISYISCYFFYLLSVLSQPSAVIFPLFGLLTDFIFREDSNENRRKKTILVRQLPFWIFDIIIILYFFFFVSAIKPSGGIWPGISPLFIFANIFDYFRMLFLPVKLASRYPDYFMDTVPYLKSILGVLILSWIIISFKFARKLKTVFTSGLFFILSLLPTIGLLRISTQRADRYAFLTVFAFSYFITVYYDKIRQKLKLMRYKNFLSILLAGYILVLAFGSFNRSKVWMNSDLLWEDNIRKYPHVDLPNFGLAAHYLESGRPDKALKLLQELEKISPFKDPGKNQTLYTNMALCYKELEQYEKAIEYFSKYLELEGQGGWLQEVVFKHLGACYYKIGELENARLYLEKHLALKPRFLPTIIALASVSFQLGDTQDALSYLDKGSEIDPNNAQIIYNYAMFYYGLGEVEKARFFLKKFIKLYPDSPKSLNAAQILSSLEH